MTFEEAIKTAIEYEIKVRDAYLKSLDSIKDETGRRVFKVLGDEEQGHIDYLADKLAEWKESGKISSTTLKTVVPSLEVIEKGVEKLDAHKSKNEFVTELEMLKKALAMEQETSDFYRKMVNELKEEGKFFAPFLEIEDGHTAVVQAELDYLTKSGTFFDFQEFNMEY
jgi:rubrerythrin